jgi:hypothetical protein
VLALNSYTRWSLSELMELESDELISWLEEAAHMHRQKK